MQEKLYLGVKNHVTGDYYVAACTLPVQIGKQHDVNNQILLDPKYKTISRMHGTIERTQRGFVYTDSSGNGSRIGGLVVKESRVALSPTFQIEIENYTISRVEIEPLIVLSTSADLREQQTFELLPGRGIGVGDVRRLREKNPARPAVIDERTMRHELVDLNRWTEWELPLLGRFEVNDKQAVWVVSDESEAKVLRNKSPVTVARTPLASLDVVEVDGSRLELLSVHESRIVCGYDRCHLLNPPPLEANCRFCGRHLANAGGFSRLL